MAAGRVRSATQVRAKVPQPDTFRQAGGSYLRASLKRVKPTANSNGNTTTGTPASGT
jgi:hypothetical protein